MVALQGDLARYHAKELAAAAEEVRLKPATTETCLLVARAIETDANGLKALATVIAATPGYLVVLVSTSTPALTVIARSAGVNVSAQQLLATLVAQFGGRGGGKPELAQGGGIGASADAIIAAVRATLA